MSVVRAGLSDACTQLPSRGKVSMITRADLLASRDYRLRHAVMHRVRARHAEAYRLHLWLGVNNRGPMTAGGYGAQGRRHDASPPPRPASVRLPGRPAAALGGYGRAAHG
jgi:hypothetical protein